MNFGGPYVLLLPTVCDRHFGTCHSNTRTGTVPAASFHHAWCTEGDKNC